MLLLASILYTAAFGRDQKNAALQREKHSTGVTSSLLDKSLHAKYSHESDCADLGTDEQRCVQTEDCAFVNGECALMCDQKLNRQMCRERESCYFHAVFGCRFKPPPCSTMDLKECGMTERCVLQQSPAKQIPKDKNLTTVPVAAQCA
eukprot:GEMP01031169.1.p1 GENE.GEMP01031169.1~~GEMP01031169.1.p1  ORF type:complete len:148 (+),score=33.09 GEMP01031169.1:524-967(+)